MLKEQLKEVLIKNLPKEKNINNSTGNVFADSYYTTAIKDTKAKADIIVSAMLEEIKQNIDQKRKRTVSKEHYPQITENKIKEREIFNQAIDEVLNLLD